MRRRRQQQSSVPRGPRLAVEHRIREAGDVGRILEIEDRHRSAMSAHARAGQRGLADLARAQDSDDRVGRQQALEGSKVARPPDDHAELFVQLPRHARSEPADLEQREELWREVGADRVKLRDGARGQVFPDSRGQILSDARKLLELAVRGETLDVFGQRLQRLGAPLIGAHAEGAFVSYLEEARHLVEEARDLEVLRHGLMIHDAIFHFSGPGNSVSAAHAGGVFGPRDTLAAS